jgi:hypothetical protein
LAKGAVILGVVGELLGDGGIFETSARLQVLEEKTISDANTKAVTAETTTGQANERAGILESTAAQLRPDLEKERSKTAEAELRIIWNRAILIGRRLSTYCATPKAKSKFCISQMISTQWRWHDRLGN